MPIPSGNTHTTDPGCSKLAYFGGFTAFFADSPSDRAYSPLNQNAHRWAFLVETLAKIMAFIVVKIIFPKIASSSLG